MRLLAPESESPADLWKWECGFTANWADKFGLRRVRAAGLISEADARSVDRWEDWTGNFSIVG